MYRSLLRPLLVSGALAAALMMGGCLLKPDFSVVVTSADGVQMEVPLSSAPIQAEDGPVKLLNLQFAPWKMEKGTGIAFSMGLEFKNGAKPTSILLEEDTEEPILPLLTDNNPKLGKGDRWLGVSQAFYPTDEHVNWVMTLDNGVRVYRVTVKLADGTTHVLRTPIFVPAASKAFMRTQLGVSA